MEYYSAIHRTEILTHGYKFYNMDKAWKHDAKCNTPVTKGQIL